MERDSDLGHWFYKKIVQGGYQMKFKKLISLALVLLMAVSLLTACGGGGTKPPSGNAGNADGGTAPVENTGKTYILRIGTATGGVHPQNVWMEAFEKELEAATNGQIDVQLYPAGQLGNMAELIQGLRDGTVDSVCIPTTYFATTFPVAAVVDLSFMFENSKQLWQILSENDTLYEKAFVDNGIIPIAWLRAFERTIISSKEVKNLSDIKNLKIWCMPSVTIQKEVELLGGITSNIDVGELAPSIQNGTVDAAISDVALYASQSLHKAGATYLFEAPNDAMVSVFAVSPFWYNKLPDDLKATVAEVANKVVKETEVPYVEQMRANATKAMVGDGLKVTTPGEDVMAEIKAALMPQHEWFLNTYPEAKPVYDELAKLAGTK